MFNNCCIRSKIYLAGMICFTFSSFGRGSLSAMQTKRGAENKFITLSDSMGILELDLKNNSGEGNCIFGGNRISLSNDVFNKIFSDTAKRNERESKFFEESNQLLKECEVALSTLNQLPNENLDEKLLLDQKESIFVDTQTSVAISPESLFVSEENSLSQNISPEMLWQRQQQVYSMIKNNQAPVITGESAIYIPLDGIEEEQFKKELAIMELTRPFTILYYSSESTALSDSIERFFSEKTTLPFIRVLNSGVQKPLLRAVFNKKFYGTQLPVLVFVTGGWAIGRQGEEDKQHLQFSATSIGNGEFLSSFLVKGGLNKFLFKTLKLKEDESDRKFFKP